MLQNMHDGERLSTGSIVTKLALLIFENVNFYCSFVNIFFIIVFV